MSNLTFEEQLIEMLKYNIINQIKKGEFIRIDYSTRPTIPQELIQQLWAGIDWVDVIEQVRPQLQLRICNAIIGNMETEIKTDVKKVLTVEGVRERLRTEVYPKLMTILEGENA